MLALLGAAPPHARAEPVPDADRARTLFQQGVSAAAAHRFDDAARAFGESDALHSAPTTRYNLAAALFELGRYPEAYDALATLSWPAGSSSDTRSRADTLLKRLELRVSHLRVQVAGEAASLTLSLDGAPLPATELGKSRTLAPGEHRLGITRGRAAEITRPLSLPPRALTTVELVLAEAATPPVPNTPTARASQAGLARRWQLWAAVSGALLAGGVAGWAISAATH